MESVSDGSGRDDRALDCSNTSTSTRAEKPKPRPSPITFKDRSYNENRFCMIAGYTSIPTSPQTAPLASIQFQKGGSIHSKYSSKSLFFSVRKAKLEGETLGTRASKGRSGKSSPLSPDWSDPSTEAILQTTLPSFGTTKGVASLGTAQSQSLRESSPFSLARAQKRAFILEL